MSDTSKGAIPKMKSAVVVPDKQKSRLNTRNAAKNAASTIAAANSSLTPPESTPKLNEQNSINHNDAPPMDVEESASGSNQTIPLEISSQQTEAEINALIDDSGPLNSNNDAEIRLSSRPVFQNNPGLASMQRQARFMPPENLTVDLEEDTPVDLKEIYLQSLKRVCEDFKALNIDGQRSTAVLQAQTKALDRHYDRLIKLIEQLNLRGNVRPLEHLDNQRVIEEADELYNNMQFELCMHLNAIETNAPSVQPRDRSRSRHRDSSTTRQRIEPFAGNFQKWPNFKSKFVQFFHSNRSLSTLDKFLKLDECLAPDSEAYNTISGYDRIAENYESA